MKRDGLKAGKRYKVICKGVYPDKYVFFGTFDRICLNGEYEFRDVQIATTGECMEVGYVSGASMVAVSD